MMQSARQWGEPEVPVPVRAGEVGFTADRTHAAAMSCRK